MIANQPSELSKVEFDACVIGSGPGGIIAALELARSSPNFKVLLVEYGAEQGTGQNSLDDSIINVNPVNHHDPYECTNKGLGGTSATWGGRCVMYDEVDFIPRDIVNDGCTWDRSLFDELKPYLGRCSEYFECGTGPFDLAEGKNDKRIAEGFVPGDVTDTVLERWSMPTRFGARYQEEIKALTNLTLLSSHEARNFPPPDAAGTIASLSVRSTVDGKEVTVRAKQFIIAAGTQESTRLLLRNPAVFANLDQVPPSLGKYYQGHVSGKIASVCFHGDPKKTDYGFITEPDGTYVRRRFQLSTAALCRENLLNTAIWLDNPLYYNPAHRSGAMSFMYLAMIMPILGKRLAPPAIAHSVTKGKVTGVHKHVWNIIKDLPKSLLTPALTFYGRYCVKRKLPGVFLYSPQNRYALHFHAEQVPVESNRMELAADGETLKIHYELVDDDLDSVIRCHELLDQQLREQNCGHLDYWFPKNELPEAIRQMSKDGIHQSGTTRIGNSPQEAVVDTQLKVWGTQNLYVASTSTFPTSGQANPTYMLGLFAIRLAHHLLKNHATR